MDKKNLLIKSWIKKAEHDLGMAKLALENGTEFTDSICFHCQQYVEKMLKAYLVCLNIGFVKTHSITYLLDLIAEREKVEMDIYSAGELLEDYAVSIRYPVNDFDPTIQDAREAFEEALKVKEYLKGKLAKYLDGDIFI